MACTQILSGILGDCLTNVGGIRVVYVCNYDDVTDVVYDDATGEVKTITMAASKKFKAYNFKAGTSNLTSTLNVDAANAVNFVQSDLALVFGRQDAAKRTELKALSLADLRVIVKDSNNNFYLLGSEEPVTASAGGAETGTARTDGNKYTLTLTDYASSYPPFIPESVVSGVIE